MPMKKIPYKIKLVVFVLVAVFAATSILGVVTYRKLTGLIEKEMGMRARGVAIAAAYMFNEKMDEYQKLQTVEDEKAPFYLQMKKYFRKFKESNNLRYMYTERQINEDQIVYILDAEPEDSEYASHIGDTDDMNALRRKAYASGEPEYGPLTDDPQWGKFITGYAPLVDPRTGRLSGLIGVDIEAAEVFKLFADLRLLITGTIVVIMIVSFIISYRIAELIARPMYLDNMTGTYNHKYFQEILAAEIAKVERAGGPLTLLMLDMDYFKRINDTFGHRFGDMVLSEIARIIKGVCREYDKVSRYGGEEFAVILPGISVSEAFNVASRIRETVEGHIFHCDGKKMQIKVTISIGVAQWEPGMTKNEIIDRADKAMYMSKKQSRNIVTVYTTEFEELPEIAATK